MLLEVTLGTHFPVSTSASSCLNVRIEINNNVNAANAAAAWCEWTLSLVCHSQMQQLFNPGFAVFIYEKMRSYGQQVRGPWSQIHQRETQGMKTKFPWVKKLIRNKDICLNKEFQRRTRLSINTQKDSPEYRSLLLYKAFIKFCLLQCCYCDKCARRIATTITKHK